jgi:hypothetical protein
MALMTEDDHYVIKVYPKARKVILKFEGYCWDEYNYELTYNTHVAPVVRRYAQDWIPWDKGVLVPDECDCCGHYEFTWPARVHDIKGDG